MFSLLRDWDPNGKREVAIVERGSGELGLFFSLLSLSLFLFRSCAQSRKRHGMSLFGWLGVSLLFLFMQKEKRKVVCYHAHSKYHKSGVDSCTSFGLAGMEEIGRNNTWSPLPICPLLLWSFALLVCGVRDIITIIMRSLLDLIMFL